MSRLPADYGRGDQIPLLPLIVSFWAALAWVIHRERLLELLRPHGTLRAQFGPGETSYWATRLKSPREAAEVAVTPDYDWKAEHIIG